MNRLLLAALAALLLTACGALGGDDQGYPNLIGETGCSYALGSTRGSWDLDVAISGSKRNSAVVDIALPGQNTEPLPVNAQYHKTFSDTDKPFLHQTYNYDVEWTTGSYRLIVRNGRATGTKVFHLNSEASWIVYVHCK